MISVHRRLLEEIAEAKKFCGKEDPLRGFLFTYLYVTKGELCKRLEGQVCLEPEHRSPCNMSSALNTFGEYDAIFRQVADHIVDTSDMTIEEVLAELDRLLSISDTT